MMFPTMLLFFSVVCGGLLSVSVVFSGLIHEKFGPFDIVIRGMDDCSGEDEDVLIKFYLKLKRVNRTTVMVGGRAQFNITYDDSLRMKVRMDQLTPQGWKENYFSHDFHETGICSLFLEFAGEDGEKFLRAVNDGKMCPIQQGSHELKEVALTLKGVVGYPQFFYGKYRIHFLYHYPDLSSRQIGCLSSLLDVVPKIKRTG